VASFKCSPRYPHLIPEEMRRPNLEQLRQLVLSPDGPGWQFSEAGIDYLFADGRMHHLTVLGHAQLGYYLKFFDSDIPHECQEIWLSLGDRSRLTEVVCPDDWEASAGLFVERKAAWESSHYFCTTGERAPAIDWITESEMPETGNW